MYFYKNITLQFNSYHFSYGTRHILENKIDNVYKNYKAEEQAGFTAG